MSSSKNNSNPNPSAVADPAAAISSFWAQWLEQSNQGTQSLMDVMQTTLDPQQIQRRWLDALSRCFDEFMRSPAFMEQMKNSLKTVTDLKGLHDQMVQDAARQFGIPLVGDVAGLFERLHSTEQTILNRLQAIEDRLKAIETKG
jgi:hypothetical protein